MFDGSASKSQVKFIRKLMDLFMEFYEINNYLGKNL